MKRVFVAVGFVGVGSLISWAAISQPGHRLLGFVDSKEAKHMVIGRPNGRGNVALVADSIDKDWATSVVHLSGNVLAEISSKNAKNYTVLRADKLDYDEATGEFSEGANVRLAVQEGDQPVSAK